MAHVDPFVQQTSFRGRNDDGSETAATWKDILNANFSQPVNEAFRVRFLVEETAGGAANNNSYILQHNVNGAGWVTLGTTGIVHSTPSAFVADATPTTQQIGAGSFVAGEFDSDSGASNITLSSQQTEMEYCILLDSSAGIVNGDSVQLRVTINGTPLSAYTNTPTITASAAVTVTKTTSLASTLQKTQQISAAASAGIQKPANLLTVSSMATLAKTYNLNFTSDGQLMAQLLRVFDAEGVLQKNLSQSLNASSNLAKTFTATVIAETLLSKTFQTSFSATSLLQGSTKITLESNSALAKTLQKVLTSSGSLAKQSTLTAEMTTFLTAAILVSFEATVALALSNIEKSLTASANLSTKATYSESITLAGLLGLGTQVLTLQQSGALQETTEKLLVAASALKETFNESVTASGSIGYQRTLPFGLDIVVYETFLRTFSASAPLMKVGLQPLSLRGTVQQTLFKEIEAVGRIVFRRLLTLETETALQKQGFIILGITTYLKHVVACWQQEPLQSETWTGQEAKQSAWTTVDNKVSMWNTEEESPNGCDSSNT